MKTNEQKEMYHRRMAGKEEKKSKKQPSERVKKMREKKKNSTESYSCFVCTLAEEVLISSVIGLLFALSACSLQSAESFKEPYGAEIKNDIARREMKTCVCFVR